MMESGLSESNGLLLVIITMSIMMSTFLLYTVRMTLLKGIKISLRIAVLGMPRSGKTTLITTVFDSIMSGKIAKYATVNGAETVKRLTNDLRKIHNGQNLGPTEDKDVFAYRYAIDTESILPKKKYDVEIADFPGEYTDDFTSDLSTQLENVGLFKKEFFSWVLRADKYLFVIDSVAFRKAHFGGKQNEFVKEIEISFKNAVLMLKQELLDEKVYKRPLMVVFTKCDNFLLKDDDFRQYYLNKENPITANFFDNTLRYSHDEEFRDDAKTEIMFMMHKFDVLMKFLSNNFSTTEIVHHSSYSKSRVFKNANSDIVKFSSP